MISGDKVRLRDKKLSDARNDYAWQTDAELARLDAVPVLSISFSHYLLDYTCQLSFSTPTSHRFAVETPDGKHIGNCTYYDLDESRGEAELGIMIGDCEYWDKGYGADTLLTLVNHMFLEKNLWRVHLKTLDWNIRAQKCFGKCGFTPCGYLYRDGYSFIVMELSRERWEEQQREQRELPFRSH